MTAPTDALARGLKKASVFGLGGVAAATLFVGVGSATASADVDKVAPRPNVTSRQASENSVIRINDYGVARGVSRSRLADAGEVSAFGDVRDSIMAVPGGKARGFRGGFPSGPPMGDW